MRKVLKSTEIFHFWANKLQSEGRANSVFFLWRYNIFLWTSFPHCKACDQ